MRMRISAWSIQNPIPVVVLFPLWFFRYSRGLWLAVEWALNPTP